MCIWILGLTTQTALIVGAALCGGVLLIESLKAVARAKKET